MRKNTNRAIEFYFRHICGFEDKPRGPGGKLVDLILPPYRRSIASPQYLESQRMSRGI